jgi:membrane protein DedA with SNARE-associated domain
MKSIPVDVADYPRPVIQWATDFIDAIGLAGVALLVLLENVFPPIPSEVVLLLTGFNVGEGRFDAVSAVVAATAGSVAGAWILYGIGRVLSEERLEALVVGAGRFVGVKQRDVAKGFEWFHRHGAPVVFFGRLVPVVRSVVSIPAGADGMPLARFTVMTAVGSAVWNTVWVCIGWGLGDRWQEAEEWGSWIQYAALMMIAVATVVLVMRSRRSRA